MITHENGSGVIGKTRLLLIYFRLKGRKVAEEKPSGMSPIDSKVQNNHRIGQNGSDIELYFLG